MAGAERSVSTNNRVGGWVCAGLFVLAILPYLPTLGYDFVNFDDGTYVVDNPIVRHGLTWSNLGWAWTTMTAGNWHPITWLSHMLDCQIFGMRPGWHHLINVLIHAANAALVFLAFRAMTGMMWRSALVAALFAVHPLHVESVAWIAERKDVLSTLFGLLSLWAYIQYVRAPSPGRYCLVAGMFALSLLSKPMLVTLPFAFLLLDFWPLNRFGLVGDQAGQAHPRKQGSNQKRKISSLFLEKVPMLMMSVGSSVVTFIAQHAGGAVAPIDVLPPSARLANAAVAYVVYLSKTFWPINLAIIYPLPTQISTPKVLAAIVVLLGITIGVIVFRRSRPWLAVGWFWFVGTLVPVIGLIQVGDQSMADRYTYIPLIGIFFMLVWGLPLESLLRFRERRVAVTGAVATLIIIALTSVTLAQVQNWKNTRTLFEHAVQVTNGNFMAHNLLAGALGQQGDLNGARQHTEKSLEIRPNYAGARYNFGMILLQQRDFTPAQEQFSLAVQTDQRNPIIWNALGVANGNLRRIDEAISNYRRALELNPHYPEAYANLGSALVSQNKFDEAIQMCTTALSLRPDLPDAHASLGVALWNRGRTDESILHTQRALELNPQLVDPRVNLAGALLAKGKDDEAIAQLEYVLRVDPQNKGARTLLSSAQQKRSGVLQP